MSTEHQQVSIWEAQDKPACNAPLKYGDNARQYFIEDVHQLTQIKGLFIYCAAIHSFPTRLGYGEVATIDRTHHK